MKNLEKFFANEVLIPLLFEDGNKIRRFEQSLNDRYPEFEWKLVLLKDNSLKVIMTDKDDGTKLISCISASSIELYNTCLA